MRTSLLSRRFRDLALFALAFGALVLFTVFGHAQTTLLDASHDPTRDLCKAIDVAFTAEWKAKTDELVSVHDASARRVS